MSKIKTDKTVKALDDFIARFDLAVEHALNVAQYTALDRARDGGRFKHRTGALRDAFRAPRRNDHTRSVFVSLAAGPRRGKTPPHVYARFLEYGTRFMSARKFMAWAATYAEVAFVNALEQRLRQAIG